MTSYRGLFRCFSLSVLGSLLLVATAQAARPGLTVSVLQFGTAHWELSAMQQTGLDQANGFDLTIQTVANLGASRLSVTSGTADAAVADLLWAQSQFSRGRAYQYLPFSSSIGDIVVPADSPVASVADLQGKHLGVAGGPDSKGWVLLQAVAARQGIDLAGSVTLQYAAPPLLNEALRRGQLDAIVTYWHFAARLRADPAFRSAFAMADLLRALDLDPNLPVLGYVFRDDWAAANPNLLSGFARALGQTKQRLRASPQQWRRLQALMQADDEPTFESLRSGFVAGTPEPLTEARIADLQALLQLLGTPGDQVMPGRLFYRPSS